MQKLSLNEQQPKSKSFNCKLPIYLDNHASTPIDPEVLDIMMPFLTTEFGNAAAVSHVYGWHAEDAVEKARKQVADLIGAEPSEIIFTSGATESNNTVLKSFIGCAKKEIITSAIEHSSVIDSCKFLQNDNIETHFIEPNAFGITEVNAVKNKISSNTILVSIMAANNEIGTINDIASFSKLAHENDAFFHTDLVQAVGKIPIDVHKQNIDFASLSAHKIYGPKGVGALYAKLDLQKHIKPQMHGGKHERGLRSGTLNVASIVGFGAACELMQQHMHSANERLLKLRNRLYEKLSSNLNNIQINGCLKQRLPGNLNVSFKDIDGEELFLAIQPTIAISRGSACATSSEAMSHVLRSLKVSSQLAQASVRFGIGRFNTEEEIDLASSTIIKAVRQLSS